MDLRSVLADLRASSDTFGPLVRRQAETIPDRLALAFEHESLTYAAYNQEVNRVAGALRRAGVVKGTPVAILCLNSPLFLATLGAVAKLGAVGALINTHVRGSALTSVLRRRMSLRTWRVVHWSAYACWPLALLHGLGTGTDAPLGWMLLLTLACDAQTSGGLLLCVPAENADACAAELAGVVIGSLVTGEPERIDLV